jgi:hypothetical protein
MESEEMKPEKSKQKLRKRKRGREMIKAKEKDPEVLILRKLNEIGPGKWIEFGALTTSITKDLGKSFQWRVRGFNRLPELVNAIPEVEHKQVKEKHGNYFARLNVTKNDGLY